MGISVQVINQKFLKSYLAYMRIQIISMIFCSYKSKKHSWQKNNCLSAQTVFSSIFCDAIQNAFCSNTRNLGWTNSKYAERNDSSRMEKNPNCQFCQVVWPKMQRKSGDMNTILYIRYRITWYHMDMYTTVYRQNKISFWLLC